MKKFEYDNELFEGCEITHFSSNGSTGAFAYTNPERVYQNLEKIWERQDIIDYLQGEGIDVIELFWSPSVSIIRLIIDGKEWEKTELGNVDLDTFGDYFAEFLKNTKKLKLLLRKYAGNEKKTIRYRKGDVVK
jgi:hypothetical protein